MTLSAVAAAVGGELVNAVDPGELVTAVTTDSRESSAGALFAALRGARADGHEFAAQAVAAGAAGVLGARPLDVPTIVTTDVVEALGVLARTVRAALGATVVGITGSSGKTSTKDLVAELLGRRGPTVAPVASYNNEIGLPLTVLRADATTRHLVLEMSARAIGHIRALCEVAPPDIGVVLNVGHAHLGEFGDVGSIALAKGELVEGVRPGGHVVLNADDEHVAAMAGRARAQVVTFGVGRGADYRAVDVSLDARGRAAFTACTPAGNAGVRLRLVDGHHVGNALAAFAVAGVLGMGVNEIAEGLEAAAPRSRWRMEVHELPDGVTVVNDAYNANPESMRAALAALVAIEGGRRHWAVLGEMAELGAAAPAEHIRVGRLVAALGVDRLVTVGDGAKGIYAGATEAGMAPRDEATHVNDHHSAVALLRDQVERGDVVLVKASRAIGLERVALALTGEGARP